MQEFDFSEGEHKRCALTLLAQFPHVLTGWERDRCNEWHKRPWLTEKEAACLARIRDKAAQAVA